MAIKRIQNNLGAFLATPERETSDRQKTDKFDVRVCEKQRTLMKCNTERRSCAVGSVALSPPQIYGLRQTSVINLYGLNKPAEGTKPTHERFMHI